MIENAGLSIPWDLRHGNEAQMGQIWALRAQSWAFRGPRGSGSLRFLALGSGLGEALRDFMLLCSHYFVCATVRRNVREWIC